MSNTPTRLATNSRIDAIHALKANSSEFALVLTEYDEVNDKIHRAETDRWPRRGTPTNS